MGLIRSGATRDFPFAELSPGDFHRLILHLLDRDPDVMRAENHGARGPDGAVDLIAETAELSATTLAAPHLGSQQTLVQVKRVKEFTKASARSEVQGLRDSGSAAHFDRYLLVTSCVPSAAALELLRREGAKLGFEDVAIWEASALTAKLLGHPDLIEFFFGVPDASAWLSDPSAADRYLRIRQLVGNGHPLMLVVGSRPEFDFAPQAFETGMQPGDSLRWLIKNRVVHTVVAGGSEFGVALADLLPVYSGHDPPRERALWQPADETPLGEAVLALLNTARESTGRPPVLAVLGCDQGQSLSLHDHMPQLLPLLAKEGVLLFDNPELHDTPQRAPSPDGQAFLSSLHELAAPDWLSFHLKKLDFNEPYDFDDILAGRTVGPGIARSGHWPVHRKDQSFRGRPLTIEGLPGTGKSARGFRIAFRLSPRSSYYLDLATVPAVTTRDLGRLVHDLERQNRRVVLLLDNAHTAESATDALINSLSRRKGNVQLVAMITKPFSSLEMLGGEIRQNVEDSEWKALRASLVAWAGEHVGRDSANLRLAEARASNHWHFFYLLRGGVATLTSDLDEARRDEHGDVVWYMIAAQQIFLREAATVRALYKQMTELDNWPLAIDTGVRGRWLVERIGGLLERRRIVPSADGFLCRHPYEAYGVLQINFNREDHLVGTSFRETSIRLFREAMPTIKVPDRLRRKPRKFEKYDFKRFVFDQVEPALTRQRELEQAVPYDPELQRAVDESWSELTQVMETWPIHPLYWLFNYANFKGNLMRFSPFSSLASLPGVEGIRTDSDAIDLEYLVKGLLANEALTIARLRTESEVARNLIVERIAMIGRLREIAETAQRNWRRIGANASEDGDLEEAKKRIRMAKARLRALGNEREDLRLQLARIGRWEIDPLELPFELDLDGDTRWELEHSAMWLEHQSGILATATREIDHLELLRSMESMHPAGRSLALAHLWLLSSELGRKLFRAMQPEWRAAVLTAVKEAPDNFSVLHLSASDDFFVVFLAELAQVAPEIDAWIEAGNGGAAGERIRASGGVGVRKEISAETAQQRLDP